MIAKHEFNILARFEVRNALDEFFDVIGHDIFLQAIDGGFAGIVGGYRFKRVI